MTDDHSMGKIQYDHFLAEGFDELGAFVMVVDGYPHEERFRPTLELLEAIGYRWNHSPDVREGEYSIKMAGEFENEAARRTFFTVFKMGKHLIQYQPINRCLFRGKSLLPHRPESDFRFADWYPVKGSSPRARIGKIEEQLADDFPNAALAAQFLYDHGFTRRNTYKRLQKNNYFVACRHGDGQPSGIVFRGKSEIYFYDYFEDERYQMGSSGLLKDYCLTKRQLNEALSLVVSPLTKLGSLDF